MFWAYHNNLSQILSDLDCSFFLVTVDLWSADGQHEMNLVLHPSSTERHPSSKMTKKKVGSTSAPAHRPTPAGHSTPTLHYRATEVIDGYLALQSIS